MCQVFHVVGPQGSGKSSLILLLAEGFEALGKRCVGVDDFGSPPRAEVIAADPMADVVFLERYTDADVDAEPGDWVLHCQRK